MNRLSDPLYWDQRMALSQPAMHFSLAILKRIEAARRRRDGGKDIGKHGW